MTHALTSHPESAVKTILAIITTANKKRWQSDDPDTWARESFEVAKSAAYALPQPPERTGFAFPRQYGHRDACGPVDVFRLSATYEERAEKVASEQIAKAAVRLAFILQQQMD